MEPVLLYTLATPFGVPMTRNSTHKERRQRCWRAALGSTEGYAAAFKIESPLRSHEEQSSAVSMYDLQTPSTKVALGQAVFAWMWRATGVQVQGVQRACPKEPVVNPSYCPGNIWCILQRTGSGLVLCSCQLFSSGAAADSSDLTQCK